MRELSFIALEDSDVQTFLASFHVAKKTINKMIRNHELAINGQEINSNMAFKKTTSLRLLIMKQLISNPISKNKNCL